jgi:hypothetical protein
MTLYIKNTDKDLESGNDSVTVVIGPCSDSVEVGPGLGSDSDSDSVDIGSEQISTVQNEV